MNVIEYNNFIVDQNEDIICKKHKSYRGHDKPTDECITCFLIWIDSMSNRNIQNDQLSEVDRFISECNNRIG